MKVLIKILKILIFLCIGFPIGLLGLIIFKVCTFIDDYIIYDIKRIWKGEIY